MLISMDKWFEYSIWSEKAGNERRYFWIVDEVQENGEDRAVDSGIENSHAEAMQKIRRYIPDA